MICTFFGHSNTPPSVEALLEDKIVNLIESRGVSKFYVGNHGGFDYIVLSVLKRIKAKYKHIKYYVVLAYLPTRLKEFDTTDYTDTIYPEGLEDVPYKFAISKRNEWMIEQSDFVIAYVNRSFGGAYTYYKKAKNKGKEVINIKSAE